MGNAAEHPKNDCHGHVELGPIRPPNEARSLLVRLSRNCPWNRCRFCLSYKGATFETRSPESVMRDIDIMGRIADQLLETSEKMGLGGVIDDSVLNQACRAGLPRESAYSVALFLHGGGKTVFLQDADSLSLPVEDVETVLAHLYRRFPTIERITTYARAATLHKLGQDKLARIRRAGLTRLHVGLESGSAAVLKLVQKGATPRVQIEGGRAALAAGFELSEYVMPGLGGAELSDEHARETARVLNAIGPHFIRLRTFYPLPGSGMREDMQAGRFALLGEDAIVREIRAMIAGLDGIHSHLASDHNLNLLMEVEGSLPADKAHLLGVLDRYLSLDDDARLVFRVGRRLGYLHALDDLASPRAVQLAQTAVRELRERYGDADEGLRQLLVVQM